MVKQNIISKTSRILIITGSILLFIMAMFHGSGIFYVNDLINESNAEGFLKEIVPVLFAHPSIHLFGLAALGIMSLYLKLEARKILFLLTILVLKDTTLAFIVGGLIPDFILTAPIVCFSIARFKINQNSINN